MTTLEEKNERLNAVKEHLGLKEPGLEMISRIIYRRIKNRKPTGIPEPIRVDHSRLRVSHVKDILIQLGGGGIRRIMNPHKETHTRVTTFPGVYILRLVQETGDELSIDQLKKYAKDLSDRRRFKDIIGTIEIGKRTNAGGRILGKTLSRQLGELVIEDDEEDEEEQLTLIDDAEESADEEEIEEGNDNEIELEDDEITGIGPIDEDLPPFPVICYVGYGVSPKSRHEAHSRGSLFWIF
jgi:hypothetical protein